MKLIIKLALLISLCSSAFAQISFIGYCSGTTNCASVPAHQVGDLFIAESGRAVSTIVPTLPSGWTSVATATIDGTSTNDQVALMSCKVATTTAETVTGFTGAGVTTVVIYRGQASGLTATCNTAILGTPSFFTSTVNTTTTTATFNSVTNVDSNSWNVGFIHAQLATAGVGTAPTGMTNRGTQATSAAAHDTNGAVASFTTANTTFTTASRVITAVVEIKAAGGAPAGIGIDKRSKIEAMDPGNVP